MADIISDGGSPPILPVQPQQQKTRLKLIRSVILFSMLLLHHRRIVCIASSSRTLMLLFPHGEKHEARQSDRDERLATHSISSSQCSPWRWRRLRTLSCLSPCLCEWDSDIYDDGLQYTDSRLQKTDNAARILPL